MSIEPTQHNAPFERASMNANAVTVVNQLTEAGFEAYVVGGCLRDLILGLKPKDFDVATSATPEQIKETLPRCRLIGRRFRLAHVRFGRETIEVATFRGSQAGAKQAHENPEGSENIASRASQTATTNSRPAVSAQGMVLSDNHYGTVEEDALRRDFTINALYYDPSTHTLIDYTKSALNDIQDRKITLIGDPEQRYREDPVRMLRAIRFKAKLDFGIETATEQAIGKLSGLLANIPSARLFDECLKLFHGGNALSTYHHLKQYRLTKQLFGQTAQAVANHPGFETMIEFALSNTDERIQIGKSVNPAFLFSVLLWQPLCNRHKQLSGKKRAFFPMLYRAADEVLAQQSLATAISKRYATSIKEIWDLQYRLPNRRGNRAMRIMGHPRFRAAYDFLLLRERSGEIEAGLGAWWTEFQNANESAQAQMVDRV